MHVQNSITRQLYTIGMGHCGRARNGNENEPTDSLDTVKYHAYLRKMTRYNPTRGGE